MKGVVGVYDRDVAINTPTELLLEFAARIRDKSILLPVRIPVAFSDRRPESLDIFEPSATVISIAGLWLRMTDSHARPIPLEISRVATQALCQTINHQHQWSEDDAAIGPDDWSRIWERFGHEEFLRLVHLAAEEARSMPVEATDREHARNREAARGRAFLEPQGRMRARNVFDRPGEEGDFD